MRIWIDDVREMPYHYDKHCRSVNEAKHFITRCEAPEICAPITLIDIDHDAGNFVSDGGDYIKLLDWLEETGRNYPIRIHSMNPVGRMNMETICRRNGWTIVK